MNRVWKVFLSLILISTLGLDSAPAREGKTDSTDQRLYSLCRLWGTLKYFHPYLAYREINWDSAFATAVPLVRTARSANEYSAAIQTLLSALGDPLTRVAPGESAISDSSPKGQLGFEFSPDSILIVHLADYRSFADFGKMTDVFREVALQLPRARGAVIDVRAPGALEDSEIGYMDYTFNLTGLENALAAKPLPSPGERRRMYSGFPTEVGASSGGYWSSFVIRDGRQFTSDPPFQRPVVFIVNQHGEIPLIALALQSSHQGMIISEGTPSDASVVTTQRIDVGDGVAVEARLGEVVYGDGAVGVNPDTVLSASPPQPGEDAIRLALDWVRRPHHGRPGPGKSPVVALTPKDQPYAAMRYPALPYRLLAAAKIWSVFNYFFPYSHLMNTTWDSVLSASIPAFGSARDSIEYGLAIARMISHAQDSHVRMFNSPHQRFFGTGLPPFVVQFIENKPVVTHFLDSANALAAGVDIGDIVTSVDKEDVSARMQRYAPYISASTQQSLLSILAWVVLRGADSSMGIFTLQDANGKMKSVRVLRRAAYVGKWRSWRSGDIMKMLPGNIGYADLERLPVSMVDSMFQTFRNAKAIIFDGRGYPMGTAWVIAPRLTEKVQPVAALFSRPVVAYPKWPSNEYTEQSETYSFKQRIPATEKWRYKGPTVLLIDERAISQAEHTGLFLKAATDITFVGSNTAGANGDVTAFVLPGGISVWMSGHNVEFPDGRQLQRIGLVPDIPCRPTIKGFRAGRDEVLEKAVDYLNGKIKR